MHIKWYRLSAFKERLKDITGMCKTVGETISKENRIDSCQMLLIDWDYRKTIVTILFHVGKPASRLIIK